MAHENQDEGLIRRYLLGQLAEDEQDQLEEKMMADTDFFNQVLLAEDEMVEEYVQGELPESDRAGFEATFLSTPLGRQQVAYAKALREYVKKDVSPVPDQRLEWWKRPAFVPYFRVATAAVVLLGVGLGIWWGFFYQSEVSKGISALAYAYRDQRPLEARISGFNYAPLATTRGGEQKVDRTARNLAESVLLDAVVKHPNAATHHAAGRLYLAERKFDEAIEQFEEALKGDPNNAQLHSDYGAALLEKGKDDQLKGESGKSFEEFGQGNEHLSKALELNGLLLEALFNRALCKESMLLYRGAEEDWKIYLGKDPSSKWASEAKQKLKELEERPQQTSQDREQLFQEFLSAFKAKDDARAWQILARSRAAAGDFIKDRLIDDYLALAAKGAGKGDGGSLDALSYAGNLEYKKAHDPFMHNLCGFYKSATPSQREGVLEARDSMKRGRNSASRYNFDEARGFYEDARRSFMKSGNECEATYTAYPIANCYLQQSKAEPALALLQSLAKASEKSHYNRLLAQTLDATANANLYLRDFSTAMDNSKRSMSLSQEIDDSAGFLSTSYQLAEEYRYVNNPKKALDLHVQNLFLTYKYSRSAAERWPNYFSLSLTLYQLGMLFTAIDYQREALQLAIEADKPRIVCRSYNYLGMLLAKHGSYPEATTSVEQALRIGNSFTEEKVRVEATAPSFLQLGYIYRRLGDVDKAVLNYDQAILFYDELDSKFFDYTARKDKLLCCLEYGGCDSVEREMETVLSLYEEHRSKILEESNRNTFFDAEQSIYDLAIEFEYNRKGNASKAFQYSERSRGRSLSDLMKTAVTLIDNADGPDMKFSEISQPMSIEEIQFLMPGPAQVLQYAVLNKHTLIWFLTKDSFRSVSVDISVEDLNKRVNNFLRLVSDASGNESEDFSNEATFLYDLLIKPFEGLLETDKQLCIVPDKILNYLPFPALKSQASKRYLIEEQESGLVLSPSSTLFVTSSHAASQRGSSESETVLSVGDPVFDRKRFPNLNYLQSAAREARAIASCYQSPSLLIGAAATKQNVMSEMERSDVIHLATHAVLDEWYPLRSKLLLAKDSLGASPESSDGVLQASEIYGLNLDRAKLVVLSACQTGIERYYGGEGMVGMARPFIAKGIPLVVASLWPVDSPSTADLMISFHRHRRGGRGLPTAEALRLAQVEMLRDTSSDNHLPYHWASFITIGGYATF
jgi:CHAT domain-containing protein/Flp pilus assembly protein TadD